MTHLVDEVTAGVPGARSAIEAAYARARLSRAGAADLLDALATAAASSAVALEILLGILQADRLAQPAIRRLVVDDTDVEDIEQAVLAVVAMRIDQFRGESRFTTWLFTVATNETRMFIRSRSRRPITEPDRDTERGYLARLSSIAGDRDLIDRALQELPETHRRVVVMREVHQLEYGEIAAQLGIPVGTVRSRLHRARELLAAALRGEPA